MWRILNDLECNEILETRVVRADHEIRELESEGRRFSCVVAIQTSTERKLLPRRLLPAGRLLYCANVEGLPKKQQQNTNVYATSRHRLIDGENRTSESLPSSVAVSSSDTVFVWNMSSPRIVSEQLPSLPIHRKSTCCMLRNCNEEKKKKRTFSTIECSEFGLA